MPLSEKVFILLLNTVNSRFLVCMHYTFCLFLVAMSRCTHSHYYINGTMGGGPGGGGGGGYISPNIYGGGNVNVNVLPPPHNMFALCIFICAQFAPM